MTLLQRPLRAGFQFLEGLLDKVFGPKWNPLYHLGALGFFYFWIVAVSGVISTSSSIPARAKPTSRSSI
jgi:hypothetical protein